MKESLSRHREAAFFLLAVFLAGRSDFGDMDDGAGNSPGLGNVPSLVREAALLIGQRGEPVSPIDTHHPDGAPARASRSGTADDVEIRWNDYRLAHDGSMEVAVIPLSHTARTAVSQLTENGRSKISLNKVTSKLIVRRDTVSGRIVMVVGTYLCDGNYYRDHADELDSLGYDFRGSSFTGYFLTSRLDGTMLTGRRVVKGANRFSFVPNPLPPSERDTTVAHDHAEEDLHLFLDIHPAKVALRMTTDPISTDEEDLSAFYCSFCKQLSDNCYCAMISVCGKCQNRIERCTCKSSSKCSKCGEEIIAGGCLCCKLCGNTPCVCTGSTGGDGNTGGDSGSIGGGSGGGGGPGGGGGSGGVIIGGGGSSGGGNGTPSYVTTTTKLKSAATSAVSQVINGYGSYNAACNIGVQAMFKDIFGSSNLPPGMTGRANDMVRAWANNPGYWHSISLSEAQSYANKGYFVVIGYENPNPNKSGHVVVVVPGQAVNSPKWGCDVPVTMDTGSNRRSSYGAMNRGFGPDKKDKITVYYYIGK